MVDEKLTFADGVAAGETLIVLDSQRRGVAAGARALDGDRRRALRAAHGHPREDARLLKAAWYRIPEMLPLGGTGARHERGRQLEPAVDRLGHAGRHAHQHQHGARDDPGAGWSRRRCLLQHGSVAHMVRREMLLWVMWPAVGVLVAGGLTALVLRWSVLVKTVPQPVGAPRSAAATSRCAG